MSKVNSLKEQYSDAVAEARSKLEKLEFDVSLTECASIEKLNSLGQDLKELRNKILGLKQESESGLNDLLR